MDGKLKYTEIMIGNFLFLVRSRDKRSDNCFGIDGNGKDVQFFCHIIPLELTGVCFICQRSKRSSIRMQSM